MWPRRNARTPTDPPLTFLLVLIKHPLMLAA
jgi:hypothetical protein